MTFLHIFVLCAGVKMGYLFCFVFSIGMCDFGKMRIIGSSVQTALWIADREGKGPSCFFCLLVGCFFVVVLFCFCPFEQRGSAEYFW